MTIHFQHGKIISGSRTILDVPEIQFPDHQISTIIGANGAGKSTLLKQILQSKHTQWRGQPFQAALKCGKCAWVGQHESFQLPMTLLEYVLMACYPKLAWHQQPNRADKEHAAHWLQQFELDHLINKRIDTLSGGEKQRAAIVRALLQNAEILLLDEPTNHLDIRHQHVLMQQLRALNEPKPTIIMVLHDLNLAAHYSDFVALMKDGKVVTHGETSEVMQAQTLSQLYDWQIIGDVQTGFQAAYTAQKAA
ncbi:ABC transporter ATP-binding protein [Kingella kingae]|uniref:ABC transporter ATP-binding protein n=1 Tax=Kingella TaxID=32257 RepID=UPI00050A0A5A|nr:MULTISPECIES: ABC transporter ATP-binding protein [Kingella]MDK4526873.1 ABC transporter ATP-binding protein [Kingella kingae]MDK4532905.1 ABC transporter ATP-binding protein [Kingella kingae]WII92397.1 ABC transporter ATP-binding protein [Kingella negevensis]